MKVLYIVHANSWDEYSGTPIIADQYAKASLEKGCEVCIVTPTFERIDFKNQKKNSSNDIFFLK